jgi:hypothetical protein
MQLRAEHVDGFTEHHVWWILEASQGAAIIEASWRDLGGSRGRMEHVFEMEFPDSRIRECAVVLATLKPLYNGHVDDFPQYSLSVTDGENKMATKVLAGINWPIEDNAAVDSFMRLWRPLHSEVNNLLATAGLTGKRK